LSLDGEKQTPVIGAECCFNQEICNWMVVSKHVSTNTYGYNI